MEIPVLIEPTENNGFRARVGEPLPLTAEGATPDEAFQHLQEQWAQRLSNGTSLRALEVPSGEHPLARFAGIFKDDEDFLEVVKIMEENRRKKDADPEIL